jgi:acid phosphatase (class B)
MLQSFSLSLDTPTAASAIHSAGHGACFMACFWNHHIDHSQRFINVLKCLRQGFTIRVSPLIIGLSAAIVSAQGEELMLRKNFILTIVVCLFLLSCSPIDQEENIRWITFDDIADSIQSHPPMNVGFDIDDTVLFSSPGYYYGQMKYSPENNAYLKTADFWKEMNNGLDDYSLPKEIARKLITLHRERGDNIYFITGREPTENETLTALLAKTFELENPNKVIFTGSSKTENLKILPLREHNIQIYYGDSDSDIRATQSLRIRAIRIVRAGNSTHKPFPEIGRLGEEVLRDSQF